MSKGIGIKQREILLKVKEEPFHFYLIDLLPKEYKLSEYQSYLRSAISLQSKGLVDLIKYRAGTKKLLVSLSGLGYPSKRPDTETVKHKCISGTPLRLTYTHKD